MCYGSAFRDCHGIVFYCHDLYPVDFRCADSPENGIQTAGEVGVCCIDPIYIITRLLAPLTGW